MALRTNSFLRPSFPSKYAGKLDDEIDDGFVDAGDLLQRVCAQQALHGLRLRKAQCIPVQRSPNFSPAAVPSRWAFGKVSSAHRPNSAGIVFIGRRRKVGSGPIGDIWRHVDCAPNNVPVLHGIEGCKCAGASLRGEEERSRAIPMQKFLGRGIDGRNGPPNSKSGPPDGAQQT
jgi:hypothetical protein